MKKLTVTILALICALCCVFGLAACGEEKNIAVTDIQLNKTELTLSPGDADTLKVIFTPKNATNKSVTWTSDSPAFVKVERGVVTALAPGSATVTATAGELSASCIVTVKPIKMSAEEWTLCVAEFEAETNYTETWYDNSIDEVLKTFMRDGTMIYQSAIDNETDIYQKQGETYFQYNMENESADWTKTTVDEETYLKAVTDQKTKSQMVAVLLARYSDMDYDGTVYSLDALDFNGIDVTDVKVYVTDGTITAVTFYAETHTYVKIGNIGYTEIPIPTV